MECWPVGVLTYICTFRKQSCRLLHKDKRYLVAFLVPLSEAELKAYIFLCEWVKGFRLFCLCVYSIPHYFEINRKRKFKPSQTQQANKVNTESHCGAHIVSSSFWIRFAIFHPKKTTKSDFQESMRHASEKIRNIAGSNLRDILYSECLSSLNDF